MNRTIGIVLVVLIVLGVAIFINAQRKDSKQWHDGTYVARSAPDERGYYGEIEVEIKDNKISNVNYEEKDQEGRPKGADYPYQAGPQSHKEYEKRLEQTSDPEKVDVITGATETHGRFKEAAMNALQKAKEGDQSKPPTPERMPEPVVPPRETTDQKEWKDGTYSAKTELDNYGFYGEIELVIEDGKITEVNYDEKDQEGNPKGEEYPYPLGPESEDDYEERLLETQDPEKVDVITGATETWERFKETAEEALRQAE